MLILASLFVTLMTWVTLAVPALCTHYLMRFSTNLILSVTLLLATCFTAALYYV